MTDVLADQLAIRELTSRFNFSLDAHDAEAVVELFTENAELILGPHTTAVGHEAIRNSVHSFAGTPEIVDLGQGNTGRIGQSAHLTTDNVITLHADHATQVSYLVLFSQRPLDAPVPNGLLMVSERFDDELERTANGWKFTKRVMTVLHTNCNFDKVFG